MPSFGYATVLASCACRAHVLAGTAVSFTRARCECSCALGCALQDKALRMLLMYKVECMGGRASYDIPARYTSHVLLWEGGPLSKQMETLVQRWVRALGCMLTVGFGYRMLMPSCGVHVALGMPSVHKHRDLLSRMDLLCVMPVLYYVGHHVHRLCAHARRAPHVRLVHYSWLRDCAAQWALLDDGTRGGQKG